MPEYHYLTDAVRRAEREVHADLNRQIAAAMEPIVLRHRGAPADVAALEGGDVIDVESEVVDTRPRELPAPPRGLVRRIRTAPARLAAAFRDCTAPLR